MADQPTTTRRRRRAASVAPAGIPPVPMPPESAKEAADRAERLRMMDEAIAILHQRNLDTAVSLAQMAARGQGPLVAHFGELGRRFRHLLDAPKKPGLRVIAGGAA
jgi:hypothetical protein